MLAKYTRISPTSENDSYGYFLTLYSHFLIEIGSSLQCRDITNGNGTLTDGVVSAPKAGDELINLDNGEILLPKQCSGSSVAVIII